MLELKEVKKVYNSFTLDVSLSVPKGQIVGLVGANGAGKSTTFKSILHLIRPRSGSIELFGTETMGRDLTKKERERLGVVLSDSGFFIYLTASDIMMVQQAMYPSFEKDRFLKLCRELEIPLDKQIKDFSTGMKAKLKVAAALCHKADLLILDEPTAGLDVIARDTVLDLLRDYLDEREDASILISSHISSDLESICDSFYMIHDGSIIFHEDTDVLLSEYAVLKVTDQQYNDLDKKYIIRVRKENFGWKCLTHKKRFYAENYPDAVFENGGIDDLVLMMVKGEVL